MAKPLYEQHRPQTWENVTGQDKAVAKLKQLSHDESQIREKANSDGQYRD